MRIAALVVGCDDYPDVPPGTSPDAGWGSAVLDALAMRDWLLSEGGVAPSDLRMLVSTAPGTTVPGDVRVDGPADHGRLDAEVNRLLDSGSGDRLYVYIAARGCPSSPAAFLAQPLIMLPERVSPNTAVVGVAVEELAGWLAQADFGEVVTLIDGDRGRGGLPDDPPVVPALKRSAVSRGPPALRCSSA